jgi:glycosyltransferase involved in cell wall biosynthesis
MKRLLFVDHSFHRKTGSSEFFIDMLKTKYQVTCIEDTRWDQSHSIKNKEQNIVYKGYDILVFWQQINPQILKLVDSKNIIYVPMYDACGDRGLDYWYTFKDIKIINFSKTLELLLVRSDFNTLSVKYFPKPIGKPEAEEGSCFFWQRITEINWPLVKDLLKNSGITTVHIHRAVDPGHIFYPPSTEDIIRYRMTFSDWFCSRDEYEKIMHSKQVYIAPRIKEGIGLSFLEAMAAGRVVVAPNLPTMNEYIIHSENGYLYDPYAPTSIKFSDLDRIAKNAIDTVIEGHKSWEIEKEKIFEFIESPMKKNYYFARHPLKRYNKTLVMRYIKIPIKYIVPYGALLLYKKWKDSQKIDNKQTRI